MEQRRLGAQGLVVSAMGLGCMTADDLTAIDAAAPAGVAAGERYPAGGMARVNL
jgi:hypothetical protein